MILITGRFKVMTMQQYVLSIHFLIVLVLDFYPHQSQE